MTRKSASVYRYYDRLALLERVQLFLEAAGRGDFRETELLRYTCPLGQFHRYRDHLLILERAANLLLLSFLLDYLRLMITLLAPATASTPHSPLATGHRPLCPTDAGPPTAPPSPPATTHRPLLYGRLMRGLSRHWHGFATWCREQGHDPDLVFRAGALSNDAGGADLLLLTQLIDFVRAHAGVYPPGPDPAARWRDRFAPRSFFAQPSPPLRQETQFESLFDSLFSYPPRRPDPDEH
jgi:hypothetical protein